MADETLSPISAPKPPAVNPLGEATSTHAPTLKLKPVIRKPVIGGTNGVRPGMKLPTQKGLKTVSQTEANAAPAALALDSMEHLKTVTQKLKGITQQIPQQAILHKTGIIADQNLTEAQKQASKSRTVRISLSEAIGVAPVQNDATPMKTIRIKRPQELTHPPADDSDQETVISPLRKTPPAPAEDAETVVTQKRTLKISRPGASIQPAGKFAVKKPGATSAVTRPKLKSQPAEKSGDAVAEIADIADLGDDSPTVVAVAPQILPAAAPEIKDVPAFFAVFDLLLQIAACVGITTLGWWLYNDYMTEWF